MSPELLLQAIPSLGVGGFAVLVMWWMSDASTKERQRNDERMDTRDLEHRMRQDKKDDEFKKLNEQVRTDISLALAASTSALTSNTRTMERVLDKLSTDPK